MKIPLLWLKDYIDTNKSAKELAASFTQLGLMLDKPLDKSNVLDLEHRMDRSDWLSIIGCARDLAAFENISLQLPQVSRKPGKTLDSASKIQINVHTPAVRRFQTRIIAGVKVGPSPQWLTERLTAYGMEPINNIVDITNYAMVEYGQTMHAQDIAKLKAPDITIRNAKAGEKIITLLGTEVKLDPDVFVLTSGGEVTVIGGIVGGKNTGVTKNTTDIILDAGNYDSHVIRKTSRRLKIINESVARNDKFLDPRLIDAAIARATDLILKLAGGTYYGNDDYYPHPTTPKTMTLRLSRLHLVSSMDLDLAVAKKLLQSLGYIVIEQNREALTVEIPYFRTDIEVEDDLVSDILRIHNYTHIPLQSLATPTPDEITPTIYHFEDNLRDLLVGQGMHEHITSSLVTSNDESDQIVLANALSTDQNALRTSLIPGLEHVLTYYRKQGQSQTPVFEIGRVFRHHNNQYQEGRLLSVLFPTHHRVADSLATLFSSLGISQYYISQKLDISLGTKLVGSLTSTSYSLITDALISHLSPYSGIVSDFTHSTTLDLSLLVEPGILYADIIAVLNSLTGHWTSIFCKTMTPLGRNNNYLLSVTWPSVSKTVNSDKKLILQSLHQKLNITSKS